jgi:hypothetical protein
MGKTIPQLLVVGLLVLPDGLWERHRFGEGTGCFNFMSVLECRVVAFNSEV